MYITKDYKTSFCIQTLTTFLAQVIIEILASQNAVILVIFIPPPQSKMGEKSPGKHLLIYNYNPGKNWQKCATTLFILDLV